MQDLTLHESMLLFLLLESVIGPSNRFAQTCGKAAHSFQYTK